MPVIDHVFLDAGLATPFDTDLHTLDAAALNGADGDGVFYVGTAEAANQVQAESDPGIDPLTVAISDANPGSEVEAAHLKLALTAAGLAAATPGAPLNLGATILGGAGNAVAVHFRWANSIGAGVYSDITLDLPARVESAI